MRSTEHLPVAPSVLGRYRSLPRIAPRAGAGDRGRSAEKNGSPDLNGNIKLGAGILARCGDCI